jgi:hypothetical protein
MFMVRSAMDDNPNKTSFIHPNNTFLSHMRLPSSAQIRDREIIKGWLTITTIRSQQDKIRIKK